MNVEQTTNSNTSKFIASDLIKKFRAQANTAKDSKAYATIINTVATQAKDVRSASVSKQLFSSVLTILSSHKYIDSLNASESIIEALSDALKHNVKTVNYIAVACKRNSNNFLFACAQALTENETATKENVRKVLRQYSYAASTDVQVSMTLNTLKALRAIDCDTRSQNDACNVTRDENFEAVTSQFLNHNMIRSRTIS